MNNARIRKVHGTACEFCGLERVKGQGQDFEIGLQPGVAVYLCAELQGFAAGLRTGRQGVQNRAAVTQAGHALAVEQVRVNARHLRRAVRAHAQCAARQLIYQLEGLQVQPLVAAAKQRLQMLHQRRHDQLIAIATRRVQQFAPYLFDMPRLGGQDIGNVIRQDPGGHRRQPSACCPQTRRPGCHHCGRS